MTTIFDTIISESGLAAIKEADIVVGSLDNEGSRLLLLKACGALGTPYINLATEVFPGEDMVVTYAARSLVKVSVMPRCNRPR